LVRFAFFWSLSVDGDPLRHFVVQAKARDKAKPAMHAKATAAGTFGALNLFFRRTDSNRTNAFSWLEAITVLGERMKQLGVKGHFLFSSTYQKKDRP
jgi:hypothetical protein